MDSSILNVVNRLIGKTRLHYVRSKLYYILWDFFHYTFEGYVHVM